MIVLDASAVVALVLDLEPADQTAGIRQRLRTERRAQVPHLLDVEVTSTLRRHILTGRYDPGRGRQALRRLGELPLVRWTHAPLLGRGWPCGTSSPPATRSTWPWPRRSAPPCSPATAASPQAAATAPASSWPEPRAGRAAARLAGRPLVGAADGGAGPQAHRHLPPLGAEVVVYAYLHRSFVRRVGSLTVANTGSVGWPVDGDWRPSYLLLEGDRVTVRRVRYDLEREIAELAASAYPSRSWLVQVHRRARLDHPFVLDRPLRQRVGRPRAAGAPVERFAG